MDLLVNVAMSFRYLHYCIIQSDYIYLSKLLATVMFHLTGPPKYFSMFKYILVLTTISLNCLRTKNSTGKLYEVFQQENILVCLVMSVKYCS